MQSEPAHPCTTILNAAKIRQECQRRTLCVTLSSFGKEVESQCALVIKKRKEHKENIDCLNASE